MTRQLRDRLRSRGIDVRRLQPLSQGAHSKTFLAELSDGQHVKIRTFAELTRARAVWRILHLTDSPFPRPLARSGGTLVLEYIDGTPLDRWLRGARRRQTARMATEVGSMLARVHALPAPPIDKPVFPGWSWAMARALDDVRRHGGLKPSVLAKLEALAPPRPAPLVVSHGDPTMDNVIVTRDGYLRFIDEEWLLLRPRGFDLSRVVTRWRLNRTQERHLLAGYAAGGGDARSYLRDRVAWIACSIGTSAMFHAHNARKFREVLADFRALVHGR